MYNGNIQWNKTYGGNGNDIAESVKPTVDGGYIINGYTETPGFGFGSSDGYLIKTDANGNIEWTHTFGGTSAEFSNKLIITPDGGYALASRTMSFGSGNLDFYFIKTDANGNTGCNEKLTTATITNTPNVIVSSGGVALIANPTVTNLSPTVTSPATVKTVLCPICIPPLQPGVISGSTNVCANSTATYSINAVSGATSYYWSVPADANIITGQGTTYITVTFGTSSGNISVAASNSCGTSGSAVLAVTVTAFLSGFAITPSGTNTFCQGEQIILSANTGFDSYLWNTGANTQSIVATEPGIFKVTATKAIGCADSAFYNLSLSITPPLPNAFIEEQWTADFGGQPLSFKTYTETDLTGNVYVAGTIMQPGTSYDYMLLKYDSSGILLWRAFYNGPVNGIEIVAGMAKDADENIYITGSSEGNGTGKDYATLKFDSLGALKWSVRYNGTLNANDEATGIAVKNNGSVIYVSGSSEAAGQGKNIVILKYNSAGVQQSAKTYNGPGNGDDIPHAIALTNSGKLFVAGESAGSGTDADIVTIKYGNSFNQEAETRYNGSASGKDAAKAMELDQQGNVYVAGYSTTVTGKDFTTIINMDIK